MKFILILALFAVVGLFFFATTAAAAMPKTGDTAPLIQGQDQDGKTVKLADFIGKKVVLTFF